MKKCALIAVLFIVFLVFIFQMDVFFRFYPKYLRVYDVSAPIVLGEVSLASQPGKTVSFNVQSADYPQLSALHLRLRYVGEAEQAEKNEKRAQLMFELFDDAKRPLFTSTQSAYLVFTKTPYPIGFTPQADSAGKNYTVRLTLNDPSPKDAPEDVVFMPYPRENFGVYMPAAGEGILTLVRHRLEFVFTNYYFLGIIGMMGVLLFLYVSHRD